MGKGKIRLIGAPPASGKSAVKAALADELGSDWLVLEHEQVFTPEMRVKTAELAGIELSSKEFVLGANLPGQMAFQALLRSIADTGLNVVGMGPFENVFSEVNGMPLWQKMRTEDFGGYDLNLVYFLVIPRLGQSWDIEPNSQSAMIVHQGRCSEKWTELLEEGIQRRLGSRANKSSYQAKLDGDKVGVADYYRRRVALVLRSARTFGLPILQYDFEKSPFELARQLAKAVLKE